MLFRRTVLFSTVIFFVWQMSSQNNSEEKIYAKYDQLVGLENTDYFNGTEFTDPYLNTNGTFRYYNSFDYTEGSVEYAGQLYPNVQIKYDLLEDNLITHSTDNLAVFNVKLIPEKIGGFSMYGRRFLYLPEVPLDIPGNDLYEVGFQGNLFQIYIKHQKKIKSSAIKGAVQYRFLDGKFYLLKYRDTYFKASNIRDVRKIFPDWASQIKEFHKTYMKFYKTDRDGFMVKLIKHLDDMAEKQNL